MKKLVSIFLLICSFQELFTSQSQHSSQNFSVMTWNILGPWAPDINNFFDFKGAGDTARLGLVGQWIEYWGADVVCLQEFGGPYAEAMLKGGSLGKHTYQDVLPNYVQVAKQEKNPNQQGYITAGTAIYLKQSGNLSLVRDSQTQKIFTGGVKTPGRSVCAWVLLQNNLGEKVLVASVHISRPNERQGQETGEQEWGFILQKLLLVLQEHKCTAVMVGDFNTFYEEVFNETKKFVTKTLGSRVDFWMYRHSSWTANSLIGGNYSQQFNPMQDATRTVPYAKDENVFEYSAIDHVLYSQQGLPVNLKINDQRSWVGNGAYSVSEQGVDRPRKVIYDRATLKPIHEVFPSDHLPIYVTFDFVSTSYAAVPSQSLVANPASASLSPVTSSKIIDALKLAVHLKPVLPSGKAKSWPGGNWNPLNWPL